MTPEDDLPCEELVELVTDHLDGALDEPTRHRVEAHLAECDGCERYVEQVGATVAMLGGLPTGDLSDAARHQLQQAYRAHRG
jgi:anti-sigma factor RsiW